MVDRGAGEGCRIVISKRDDSADRDDGGDVYNTDWYREQAAIAERQNEEHLRNNDDERKGRYLKFFLRKSPRGDEAEGLIAEPEPVVDNPQTTKSANHEDTLMPVNFSAVVTSHGIALFKYMVSENSSFGLSEEDVVKLATEHAARIYPGDRGDVAFAKMFSSTDEAGATLRAAVEVAKNASLQDAVAAEVEKDVRAACAELAKIGAQRWPSLTKAQQFARAAETNPTLLAKAHRRPGPSVSFPYPIAKEQPTVLNVADIMPRTSTEEDVDDPAEALAQLRQLGRDRWPNESEAQQFLNAMTTAEYGDLIRRALGRPTGSTPPRQS